MCAPRAANQIGRSRDGRPRTGVDLGRTIETGKWIAETNVGFFRKKVRACNDRR